MKGGIAYATGEAAQIGLAEMARHDLAEDNIGISALIPVAVISNIFNIARTRPGRFVNAAPPQPAPRIKPGLRWMQPEAVGDIAVKGRIGN